MEKRRSVGITICSVLVMMLGVSYFWFFHLYISKRSIIAYSTLLKLQEIVWLAMAIGYIISAVFLLSLKRLARLLIILITFVWMIDYVVWLHPFTFSLIKTLIAPKHHNANYSIIWLLLLFNISILCLFIGIIVYLTRPKVKEQFR